MNGKILVFAFFGWANFAFAQPVENREFVLRDVHVTVRTADIPYKRLPASHQMVGGLDVSTSTIKWETIPLVDPLVILENVDALYAESFANWIRGIVEVGPSKDIPAFDVPRGLTCKQYRDIGWTASYIAGNHAAGHDWYVAAIAAGDQSLQAGIAVPETVKLLYSLRAKLYGAEDWSTLEQLCIAVLKVQKEGTEDDFWWRLFHAMSFGYRGDRESKEKAVAMMGELAQTYRESLVLGEHAKTELSWMQGLFLYEANHFGPAIPHLRFVAGRQGFSHRGDAWLLLVAACAKSGDIERADLELDQYIRVLSPDVEVVRQLMRVIKEGKQTALRTDQRGR